MYKIVFMGTPDFSVSILKAIFNAGHDVALAVSQPDKPAGRDLKIKPTPVKQFCQEHNIPILQPDKIRNNTEFINELKKKKFPKIFLVRLFRCAYLVKQPCGTIIYGIPFLINSLYKNKYLGLYISWKTTKSGKLNGAGSFSKLKLFLQ